MPKQCKINTEEEGSITPCDYLQLIIETNPTLRTITILDQQEQEITIGAMFVRPKPDGTHDVVFQNYCPFCGMRIMDVTEQHTAQKDITAEMKRAEAKRLKDAEKKILTPKKSKIVLPPGTLGKKPHFKNPPL